MKKLYFSLFTFSLCALSYGQNTIVFQESFETGNSGTPSDTCNDGIGDFFTRTDGSDIGTFYEVTGMDGTFFFAAMDLDGDCSGPTQTLIFDDIDISTYTDLTFAMTVAEDDDGANEDWDDDTLVYVEVDIDNSGTFIKIMQFAAIELRPDSSPSTTNKEPALDTDFDGVGDGTRLSSVFSEFSADIAGTGSVIDIRITFEALDAGDEDISIDNIRIVDNYSLSTDDFNTKSFSVYPNPTNTGSVNVVSSNSTNFGQMNIAVYDVLGKQVINKVMSSEKLNVSSLNAGVYIMKITQGKAISTKKLVIN